MRAIGQTFWSATVALVLLASPSLSAESVAGKRKPAAGAITSGSQSGREAGAMPATGPANADVEKQYAAARKAAEKREGDWDRKMKQLTKDVCTGC